MNEPLSSNPLVQRLKDLGQGGFDLDFDTLPAEVRQQCVEAENLSLDALTEIERLRTAMLRVIRCPAEKQDVESAQQVLREALGTAHETKVVSCELSRLLREAVLERPEAVMELRRKAADEIDRLKERVADLRQFHDWAEPQITDLNRGRPDETTGWRGVEKLAEQRNAAIRALERLRRWAILNIAVTPPNQADLPEWRETIKEVDAAIACSPEKASAGRETCGTCGWDYDPAAGHKCPDFYSK